ncbi:head to tail connecting protein [Caudoviricetes sp.]|nr:head to tail connecting protein [Caudoviricetes sp.]
MAGKTAQIKEVLNPDNLAKQLTGLYSQWLTQRAQKEAEWRELRNYIFATDTTKTTNSKLPWKNKTTLPKLTQIRDNLHANYMDALFPNDNWLRWEGYSADSVIQKKRTAIEAYMKNKLRESGFRETVSRLVYDYIDYGNVIAEATWVNEKHVDPTNKEEEITTYVGPKAIRVSPFDIVFNPTALSFKDSPKFTRYLKNVGELKKDIQENPNLQYNEEVLDKILSVRKAMTAFRMEDINKSQAYLVDGFGSLSEYLQSGIIELLEFEGDIYDQTTGELKQKRIITIVDRSYILRDIPNPSWLGTDSKVHVSWRERSDNLYGMGPLDNLVGLQYRVDHLENLKADALDLTIHPPLKKIGEVAPFVWQPGAIIDISEDGDVVPMPPNQAAFMVNNEIGYLLALMEEMAGAPKEAMGIRTPGEKTAFEVQQLQNAAGRIFQNKVNKFEIEFLEPLINKMLELAKRYLDATDVARVMDDDLGIADFISITKEDITAKGKLRPIGARHYAARAQMMQNMLGIFNSPVGQMIAPHISAKALAKLVEEQMGFEQYQFIKDNVAIFEQQETQRLVNQASATLETEAQVPVEENLLPQA